MSQTTQRRGRFQHLVHCAAGQTFVTTWVPLQARHDAQVGEQRFQYCPVGDHWRMVEPVQELWINAAKSVEVERAQTRILHESAAQHDAQNPRAQEL